MNKKNKKPGAKNAEIDAIPDDAYERAARAAQDSYEKSKKRAIAIADRDAEEEDSAQSVAQSGGLELNPGYDLGGDAKTEDPVDWYARQNPGAVNPDRPMRESVAKGRKTELERPSPETESDKKRTADPGFFENQTPSGDIGRLQDLMSRYRAASERKQNADRLGFILSMGLDDPNEQREMRTGFAGPATEGLEAIDRELKGYGKQVDNDRSLFELARKRSLSDPNSPLSKALLEYESKTKGFATGATGISAQDLIDAGRTTNPTFKTVTSSEDSRNRDATRERIAEEQNKFKTWSTIYTEQKRSERNNETNRYRLAAALYGQQFRQDSNGFKFAQGALSKSFQIPENVRKSIGAATTDWTIPSDGRVPSDDDAKKFKDLNESADRYLGALNRLRSLRKETNPSRLAELSPLVTQFKAASNQLLAVAKQTDTKWNDNGVLNANDAIAALESLGGDPGSIKNALLTNKDIINALDRSEETIKNAIIGSSNVRNYVPGDVETAIPSAVGAMRASRSSTAPVIPGTQTTIDSLIGPNAGQPITPTQQPGKADSGNAGKVPVMVTDPKTGKTMRLMLSPRAAAKLQKGGSQ